MPGTRARERGAVLVQFCTGMFWDGSSPREHLQGWEGHSVKNCEGFEILSQSQLTCWFASFMDASRKQETSGLEIKDSLLLATMALAREPAFLPLFPVS